MTEKEKMLAGKLYLASDAELTAERVRCQRLLRRLNRGNIFQTGKSARLLGRLFGAIGKNVTVERPFRCDYGRYIFAGDNLFVNYNCTILDVCPVRIGNNVFLAPNVSICTATHPIDAEVRNTQLEYGQPVTIGNNVWIGSNVVINPGVTIGSNVVIASGAVVTKDIPSGCVAAGNPCAVKRPITETDKEKWRALAGM